MIKAALIDLDGTILDSMQMWNSLGMKVLNSLGFSTNEDLNEKFKTLTVREAAQYYKENFPINLTVKELEDYINSTIEKAYLNEIPLKIGVSEFLEELKDKGFALALVTTTSSKLANGALKRLDVLEQFDLILSCEDLNCSKNDSTIYDTAIDNLNVNKNEAVVLEDALHAIETAKRNDYLTVGVFDSNVTEQEEIKNLADYYLENFKDSENLIDWIQEVK